MSYAQQQLGSIASMSLMSSIHQNQSPLLHNQGTDASGDSGYATSPMYTMFVSLLLSSVLITIVNGVANSLQIPDMYFYLQKLVSFTGLFPKRYTITFISKEYLNKYGRRYNDITIDKLSVLYYIQHHADNYKDIYLLENNFVTDFDWKSDEEVKDVYYNINQADEIEIRREGDYYIRLKSFKDTLQTEAPREEKTISSDIKMMGVHRLQLISNKSLQWLKDFVKECRKFRDSELLGDKKRYIFTYLGEDDHKNLSYEKEEFLPYASFSGLVGDTVAEIEREFDFFMSQEGQQWYKMRHLPYQLTHLYHGRPGVGKSIVASAIANKYNLHIVRIKLSAIKDTREFLKVFRNTKFCHNTIPYENILYLFDEIDIELDRILRRSKQKKRHNPQQTAHRKTTARYRTSTRQNQAVFPVTRLH